MNGRLFIILIAPLVALACEQGGKTVVEKKTVKRGANASSQTDCGKPATEPEGDDAHEGHDEHEGHDAKEEAKAAMRLQEGGHDHQHDHQDHDAKDEPQPKTDTGQEQPAAESPDAAQEPDPCKDA